MDYSKKSSKLLRIDNSGGSGANGQSGQPGAQSCASDDADKMVSKPKYSMIRKKYVKDGSCSQDFFFL